MSRPVSWFFQLFSAVFTRAEEASDSDHRRDCLGNSRTSPTAGFR